MKNIVFAIFLFLFQNSFCQSGIDEDAIRQNAMSISRFDTLDTRLAEIFEEKRLILIGELQGTAEPAEFVNYLVQNLVSQGRKVNVGLEISPQDMPNSKELNDAIALRNCNFFKNESFDKGSQAWFSLITEILQAKNAKFFFFGLTKKQLNSGIHHADSLMFLNIKSEMLKDTGALFICLTKNKHGKLTGDQFPVPMGYYFLQDKLLDLSLFNMVSFNNECVEGGAYFNTGNGARLHTMQNSDYFYTITGMRNYFSFTHQLIDHSYNGVLFTYHITASFAMP